MKRRIASSRPSAIPAYLAELVGTTLMIFNGLSWVCWNFSPESPIVKLIPNPNVRLCLTALCFAGGGTAIAYSPLGKRSGGHLNPSVTLGFWLMKKISTRDALAYAFMQFIGAAIGAALVLLLWSDFARSVHLGATLLGKGISPVMGFGIEVGITFLLMLTILISVNSSIMPWTGAIAGALVAFLVSTESPLTGTSLNPARSFAPAALISIWQDQWIYWIAPPLGAALAALLYRQGIIGTGKSYCSKLFHTSDIPCHHANCGYCSPTKVDVFRTTRRKL
ncbi:aquaporin [Chroococcidiopsis sp. FACHB-1243]|uniref:MIP/aquaporin family protein n=1 Tax=Chroococcidiopsis sp. [FACHB-1243] TaxID=2692781 RepID=UPI001780EC68|nr:aquaporin [Chroococcidiopsis sp. [FACHB-1243]]MBD2309317.1 aquaporin [Chroococcidiopsis sp. [FACHB-1243]]